MKRQPEKELFALSSWIVSMTGAGILLAPFHFNTVVTGIPSWVLIPVGGFLYALSLFTHASLALNISYKTKWRLSALVNAALLILAIFYIRAGFFIEAGAMTLLVMMRAIPLKRFVYSKIQFNPLHLTFILAGLSSGIFLALVKAPYPFTALPQIKNYLAFVFLLSSVLASAASAYPTLKYKNITIRLQAIPWMVWCVAFISGGQLGNIIAPGLFMVAILVDGLTPWGKLRLSNSDILGRRVILSAGTILLTVLVFISALLYALDPSVNTPLESVRNAALLVFAVISAVTYYSVSAVVMTLNRLMAELNHPNEDTDAWSASFSRFIEPYIHTREGEKLRLNAQADQIQLLKKQVESEKKRNAQLNLLIELSQQLENQLDKPVAAQLAVNTIESAIACSMLSLYVHEPDKKEFILLAIGGNQSLIIPSGYRQDSSIGVIGRAMRQRKTQVIDDLRRDSDYIFFEDEKSLSALVVPMIFNGHVNGMLIVNSEKTNAFDKYDVALTEAVASELLRGWERSGYHNRLMNLVQSGSHLSAMVEPETTAKEVAAICRDILQGRFAFVHIQLGQERNFIQSASSGYAPKLLESLEQSTSEESLVQAAFHASQPFRIRDVRKYALSAGLEIDHPSLRSAIAIPIRWHKLSIGAVLVFGKQNEVFFTENDESLSELLSVQASGAFESAWLQQELRASLRTTSLLYRLSNQIIQAENIQNAAVDIAQTAHKLAKSSVTGIVLYDAKGTVIAEAQIAGAEVMPVVATPVEAVEDAMRSGQMIYVSQGENSLRACLPIITPIQKYGAIWMDIPEGPNHSPIANPNDLQALVNQSAIALERSMLLEESRRQAAEIQAAYNTLEETYDQTLAALTSALDARDQETEGHSLRVSQLSASLGQALNLSPQQLKILERGSLMHDIGKIGISDAILHKPGALTEEEWQFMKQHPDIGAKIVEGIPFLEDTIPLIRHHQERYDGSGYPAGLKGEEIPILARLFSIVDAFDALTSNRPYRTKITPREAVAYIRGQSGILFDPEIVKVFEKLVLRSEGVTQPLP